MSVVNNLVNKYGTTITLRTYGDGGYDTSGNWSEGAATDTENVKVVSQPLNGRELEMLPEGERVKKSRKFIFDENTVLTLGQYPKNGDRIIEGTDEYKISLVITHGKPLPHTKTIGVKQDG